MSDLFAVGPLEAIVIDGPPGAASALKMAYAAWTKISTALLLDIRALARAEGVEHDLLGRVGAVAARARGTVDSTARGVAGRAWRWTAEMDEIAAAFADVGLPDGFGTAAARTYERLAAWRDVEPTRSSPAEVLQGAARPGDRTA